MYPPEWVRRSSRRLSLDEFQDRFTNAWSRIEGRFLKLECWQSYQELGSVASQRVYLRGNLEETRRLLRQEAEADQSLYEDVRNRNIEFARIRLVQPPLTDYLGYELLNYRIRADLGEHIEIVVRNPGERLPNNELFDFLLFDRHTALIHDYGQSSVGQQTGGWVTNDPEVISVLEQTANELRRAAMPLGQFRPETKDHDRA